MYDPDVIRTRSLLIWSQTRYHCATESGESNLRKKVRPIAEYISQNLYTCGNLAFSSSL